MYNRESSDKDNFENFWKEVIVKKFPKAKIKFKNESNLMSFLGWFSLSFYTGMTTVLGTTVYFPSKEKLEKDYEGATQTLAHEFVHMIDASHEGLILFWLKYLFPQILAVFSLLSLAAYWNLWSLVCLLFLLFLVPGIPAPGRTFFEANGYAMSLYFLFRGAPRNPAIENKARDLSAMFIGRSYWFMSRDRQLVESMLLDRYERCPADHEAFVEVKKWLQI